MKQMIYRPTGEEISVGMPCAGPLGSGYHHTRIGRVHDSLLQEIHPQQGSYRAPCCGASDIFEQAWGCSALSPGGNWCEYGVGGSHLEFWETLGCVAHQHYGRKVRLVGRHCPMDCEWSQQPIEEP